MQLNPLEKNDKNIYPYGTPEITRVSGKLPAPKSGHQLNYTINNYDAILSRFIQFMICFRIIFTICQFTYILKFLTFPDFIKIYKYLFIILNCL